MALASKNFSVFSKPALAKRKEKAGLTKGEVAAYVSDAFEPTTGDFRALRKEIKAQRVIYEARYRDIRDKVFAHNEIFDLDVANQLLANPASTRRKRSSVFSTHSMRLCGNSSRMAESSD
jgi:hypothetical protein